MLNNSFIKRYKSIPIARYASSLENSETSQMLPALEYHREFEVIMILEGSAKVCCGEECFWAEKGDIVLFSPYMLHSLEIPAHVEFSHVCFCFDLALLSQPMLVSRLEESNFAITTHVAADSIHNSRLGEYISEIDAACCEEKPFWEMRVRGNLNLFFCYIMQHELTVELPSKSKGNLFGIKVLSYLEEHYKEPLNSRLLAEYFNYDNSYFCRLFKKIFGLCFHEYLCLFRLEKAKVLLENPDYSITDIAYATGFSGASYFAKMFKKENRLTPKQFRKKYYFI